MRLYKVVEMYEMDGRATSERIKLSSFYILGLSSPTFTAI